MQQIYSKLESNATGCTFIEEESAQTVKLFKMLFQAYQLFKWALQKKSFTNLMKLRLFLCFLNTLKLRLWSK